MADAAAMVEQLQAELQQREAELRQFRALYEAARAEIDVQRQSLAAADAREAAVAEVLRVIASSPTDLQAVLDAVVESAARVCIADNAILNILEGERLRLVAFHGVKPARGP